jgi:hypothetical protein
LTLALALCASTAWADAAKNEVGPPLHAGDALGLAVFGNGKVAYEKSRAAQSELAATRQATPAPPAKIASDE